VPRAGDRDAAEARKYGRLFAPCPSKSPCSASRVSELIGEASENWGGGECLAALMLRTSLALSPIALQWPPARDGYVGLRAVATRPAYVRRRSPSSPADLVASQTG
jgi:hypothetical protein